MSEEIINKILGMAEVTIKAANERQLFIEAHLYLENAIDKLIEDRLLNTKSIFDNRDFTFSVKVTILEVTGLLKSDYLENVRIINKIRNEYAHKLDANDEKINGYVMSLKRVGGLTDEFTKLKKFDRYRTAAIATVSEILLAIKDKRIVGEMKRFTPIQ